VKKDLIPGHPGETHIEADQPGVYKVVCAEFCGAQHAKMGLDIVAEDEATFATWLSAQRAPAAVPRDSESAHGRLVFETGSCAMCHTITGTRAAARAGPDLTHIASRRSLAADALPNGPGFLAGWIVDPQRIKPGVRMPSNRLEPGDLRSLLAYLGSLR
jgi:cytochrome c oxidase subunit 2